METLKRYEEEFYNRPYKEQFKCLFKGAKMYSIYEVVFFGLCMLIAYSL